MIREKLFVSYDGDEGYIYASYNHKDYELVYDILTAFYDKGYRISHDAAHNIRGDFFEYWIRMIKNCKVFFCFLSGNYIDSDTNRRELNFAYNGKKIIIPIRLDDSKIPDDISFILSPISYACFYEHESVEEFTDWLCEVAHEQLEPCRMNDRPEPRKPSLLERIFHRH